jgi:DNA-binding Lrp family transcriptional regulator
VTGQFDTVAFVEFVKMDDLGKILEKIRKLNGVRRTQTLIAIPPTIRE